MIFSPYIFTGSDPKPISIEISPTTVEELSATRHEPRWQTDWTSSYLSNLL